MDSSYDIPFEHSSSSLSIQALQIDLNSNPIQVSSTHASPQNQQTSKTSQQFHFTKPISYQNECQNLNEQPTQYLTTSSPRQIISTDYPYQKILLRTTDSTLLINKFMQQKNFLRPSDAKNVQFDIDSSIARLKKGYTLLLFDYDFYKFKRVFFKADQSGISVQRKNGLKQTISYNYFLGILYGDVSSTFVMYKKYFGPISRIGLDNTDCFSLVGRLKSLDFGTPSDKARYDIYLVMSWFINIISRKSSTIPLNKRLLTRMIIRTKLVQMANQRKLSLNQLLLLAIMKRLVILKAEQYKIAVVKKFLDEKFSAASKIYRLCFRVKPKEYTSSKMFLQNFSEQIRVNILNNKMKGNSEGVQLRALLEGAHCIQMTQKKEKRESQKEETNEDRFVKKVLLGFTQYQLSKINGVRIS